MKNLTVQVPADDEVSIQPTGLTPSTPELRDRLAVNSPKRPTRVDEKKEQELEKASLDLDGGFLQSKDESGQNSEDEGSAGNRDEPEESQSENDSNTAQDTQKEREEEGEDADHSGAPAGLVTQVARPTSSSQKAQPKLVPQQNSQAGDKELFYDDTDDESEQGRGGLGFLCSMCSCFAPKRRSSPNKKVGNTSKENERKRASYHRPSISFDDDSLDGLLNAKSPENRRKKTLVLDLDETLVHSSFKPIPNPDFIFSITIDYAVHRVYVMKRPGVDEFLQKACQKYEVVIFTASLSKYANPLLDILDPNGTICARLFRESCVLHCGTYVKDLSLIGRKLRSTIIVDNSPQSYSFHPNNAIAIESWFDDPSDKQLYDLLPLLVNHLTDVSDVRECLDGEKEIATMLQEFQQQNITQKS